MASRILTPDTTAATLIEARGLTKTFATPDGELPVLEGIDLDVRDGEIVALLGKSGSGKSTLLRLLAGLIPPSAGSVRFRGEPIRGTTPHTALVFQSFALLPWLTVQANVELGLEAQGDSPRRRARRAREVLDVVGLDGFESAYPKELSGGMRQRVGFARALVLDPDVLLMDEPFSALDVLTAENLRGELLETWQRHDFPIGAIVIVTHNIEEAVLLADRIVVLGTNPGRILTEIRVPLAQPRDRKKPAFADLVEQIYAVMTGRRAPTATPAATARGLREEQTPGNTPLPHATVDGLSGLAEIVYAAGGSEDLPSLAYNLSLEVDDLLPLVDALSLLDLAWIDAGRVELTTTGIAFARATIRDSKPIFSAAISNVPLVRLIGEALGRSDDGELGEGFFLDILRRSYSADEARRQLDLAIDWGRYAELYEYDADEASIHAPRESEDGD
jgi:NitT/TauT family transport system ATP-binding protein